GEIEHALTTIPEVKAAVVVGVEDRLIAYLVPDGETLPAADRLRDHLRATLPEHMIPAIYIEITDIPLTANGKRDLTALPVPDGDRPELSTGYRPPVTATERALAAIWAELLGLDRVGVSDNFFDLGGHSLLATQAVIRIRSTLGVEVTVANLFDQPTVGALAATVDAATKPATADAATKPASLDAGTKPTSLDAATEPATTIIPRADRNGELPLSPGQQRLWFVAQVDPGSVAYNLATLIAFDDAPVDVDALGDALSALVARHEILRTRFVIGADGDPVQVVDPPARFDLEVVDAADDTDAHERASARTRQPFDLAEGPLIRGTLLRLAGGRGLLLLVLHHAVTDEWSERVLRRELSALLAGETLPPLPIQYADYAVWQRRHVIEDGHLDYWRAQLADPPLLELPLDRPRPPIRSSEGAVVDFTVPDEVRDGLRALAAGHDATMFMTLIAAYAVLLGRYTGQDDLLIGTPIANRGRAGTEDLIGFLVNTLALRSRLDDDPTFAEFLVATRRTVLDAYTHQDVPFEQLVDEFDPARDRSRTPLVQTVFNHVRREAAGQLRLTEVSAPGDLDLTTVEMDGALGGAFQYSPVLFERATIERMAGHLLGLLTSIVADPDRPVSQLDMPERPLRRQAGAESGGGIHALILARAAERPDAPAVVFGDSTLTYAELVDRSARLANHLRDRGAGAEDVVALCLDRGTDMVVAMVAVWMAGAAYLPLDPAYPADRLRLLLAESGSELLVSATGIVDRLPGVPAVVLDDPATVALLRDSSPRPPRVTVHPGQAAYLIFTSGSTGVPKGVLATHRGLANLVPAHEDRYAMDRDSVMLEFASISFDAAVAEITVPLAIGATVVVADAAARTGPDRLATLIRDHHVTVACLPPSLLAAMDPADLPGPMTIVSAGEALPPEVAAGWARHHRLLNGYGPTENTVCATIGDIPAGLDGPPPIGVPITGTEVHLLDRRLNRVPDGATGEIFIGGASVTRGYLGQPSLTAERYVPDRFSAGGGRLYRTGDLARRLPDGQLHFIGRIDHQIQIRGHRVEPGEIQHVLTAHPAVTAAVVTAHEQRLIAYVVAPSGAPNVDELRAHVAAALPGHMIPAVFVELAALPLNANGKLDRAALPDPDSLRPELSAGYRAPAGATEETVAGIWADLLGLDRVGADDDFFDLGGHSLLVARVINRVRAVFGADLPVAAVFDHPTVAGLAAVIDGAGARAGQAPVERADRTGPLPLSFAQQRLWFLAELDPDSTEYHVSAIVDLPETVDTERLARAVTAVVARHEVLRTRLVAGADGVPYQVIDPPAPVPLGTVECAAGNLRAVVNGLIGERFDLTAGPLLRATLIRAGDRRILLLAMHHVVCDEWSAGILKNEILLGYEGSPLPSLPVQYADYAVWQRRHLTGEVLDGQLDHWRTRLADPPVLELPADRPRPPIRSSEGAVVTVTVPATVADGLRKLSRRRGATMFMTLTAAYATLLHRHTGQDDLIIGTPVANRGQAETENLIGFFINTLALRARFDGSPTFLELLDQVRGTALDAFDNQDLPFEQLVDELVHTRDRSRTPLVQTVFGYVAATDAASPAEPVARFDVQLTVFETGDGDLLAAFEYSTALFDAATVRSWADHLLVLLAGVAADADVPVALLPILTGTDADRVAACNDTATPVVPASIVDLFAEQAAARPDQVAIIDGDRETTYAELDRNSDDLARRLGVQPGELVALIMPRGTGLVTAMLAVLKAGAAYLPIDVTTPKARVTKLLRDADPAVVLTGVDVSGPPAGELRRPLPGQAAYLIYTSGSTGTPKGVLVSHHSATVLITTSAQVYGFGPDDTWTLFHSPAFDFAVWEIWTPLLTGGRLVITDQATSRDPDAFSRLLARHRVTVLNQTPSAFAQLTPPAEHRPRLVIFGGEKLEPQHLRQHWAGSTLINMYGVTETTVVTTHTPADPAGPISIGTPLPNTRVHLLDRNLQPVPPGVTGEIFIGGTGLAIGYHGTPALTAARFVASPLGGGERLYRSGDLARMLPDGSLDYLGRSDLQLKVRGHRIEPAEIENALTGHPGVDAAIVTAHDNRLVAYVVPDGELPAADELRDHLRVSLPESMVPALFVEISGVPLNANGKRDLTRLPVPDSNRPELSTTFQAPRTAAERALAEIWTDLLGLDRVGAGDDFFDLGGHSLLATRAIGRIRTALGVDLPLAALFDHPTVQELAAHIDALSGEAAVASLAPVGRDRRLPLSFAQQRLWILAQLDPGSTEYHVPITIPLGAEVDGDRLAGVLTQLVERHEVLRTRIVADGDDEPYQVIDPPAAFPLERAEVATEADARALVDERARVPFDLAGGPLVRGTLIRFGGRQVLALTMHHIVCDEWSTVILQNEILRGYDGSPLPSLPVQYADYAVWQRAQDLDTQLGYWRSRLADPPLLELPTDRPRPPIRSTDGSVVTVEIPADVTARLRELSRTHGATMFMTLAAAYAVLLHRHTGQDDILIGTPVANRGQAETENLIGFFVNTLALRTRFDTDPTFEELLDEVRRTALDAFDNQDLPFEQLVEEFVRDRDRSRTPLVQTLFNHLSSVDPAAGGGSRPVAVKWDLSLTTVESAGMVHAALQYSTALFDRSTIERMADHLTTLLRAVSSDPGRPVSQLPIQDGHDHPDTTVALPPADTVLDLIGNDGTALIFRDATVDYSELHERSNQLAHHLQALGGGPETVIALPLERGFDLVIAILAIWKTGAAYLPLDPAHPEARNRRMTTTSRALLTVTPEFLADPVIATRPTSAPDITIHPDQAAYVIYTSGTTGNPKGVVNTHRALLNRIAWMQNTFPLSPDDTVLHKTPTTFDVSVWELVWPLTAGARMVIAEPGRHADLDHLHHLLHTHRVTTTHFVPSLLHHFAGNPWPHPLPHLRDVISSGEALPPADVEALHRRHPDVTVHNLYGPTEAAIDVTHWTCPRPVGTEVPIGRPIDNIRIHLLDKHLQPVPPGVTGEIHIAGTGLARGYHHQPALTAERFVPGTDGERLYRTGDLARRDTDGTIHYLGRTDHQIKIRGQRVELGEIQHALTSHPAVTAAVVTAHHDRLIAHVVGLDGLGQQGGADSFDGLREHLRERLPEHMVPAVYVRLDTLPLTGNGKLDRAALPAPDNERPELAGGFEEPVTPTEVALAGIWADLLELDRVGATDDFFALGGHSLLAIRAAGRIRTVLGADLPFAAVFDRPTVRTLAALIDADGAPGATPIVPADRDQRLPLSFGQQRLWFLAQLDPASTEYHLPVVIPLDGNDDPAEALTAITARHEVLRSRIVAAPDGTPYQVIDPPAPFTLDRAEATTGADARTLIEELNRTPFNLATGPLLRGLLITVGDDRRLLALCLHHIVADQWSIRILRDELTAASALPPLPVQYADYAVWQRAQDLDAQLGYWRTRLADPPVLEFPTDRPRPPIRSTEGAAVPVDLPAEVTGRLRELSRAHGATMFMTLAAAYAVLLHRHTGQDDLLIGTPVAGRGRAETENLIGFFVNTLALRTRFDGDPTFAELVDQVRGTALEAFANEDLPFEQLVDELVRDRDRSRTPLVQTLFHYAGDEPAGARADVPFGQDVPFDLSLSMAGSGDGLRGVFEYSTALFDRTTIERLADRLTLLLTAVATTPDTPVSELPILTRDDERQLTAGTGLDPRPTAATGVDRLIAEAAARFSGDAAVECGDVVLPYGELTARADRLAGHLRAAGAGPETVVGVHLRRGADLIVAILAVWRAGAAYLPLDPDYPADRLAYMRRDSGAALVIDEAFLTASAGTALGTPPPSAVSGRLAAVIYTSGSTGLPKATLVTHDNLLALHTAWQHTHFGPDDRFRWLSLTNISFDVFTADLVRALGTGGTLVLGPVGLQTDTAAFAAELARRRIGAFESAPRYLDQLAGHLAGTGAALPDLRLFIATTDTWHTAAARSASRVLPGVRLLTAYGITETTIDSTFGVVDLTAGHDGPTAIGRPLPGTRVHVLDRRLRPVPPGVTGELFIAGAGVTRGYHDRPALTAERFVPDPFAADGTRLYRSGDLGRLRADGQIDFLGRGDLQLKIRGYRIEPAEVQHALEEHPSVVTAVVSGQDDRLIAYLMTRSGLPPVDGLRAHLRTRLPEQLIPSVFLEVGALPLTPNGKVDLGALPKPDTARPGLAGDYREPVTPTERTLAADWARLLGLDRVGADDGFFDLGGHSLLAMQAVARARSVFGAELPLAAIFDHPTVAELGARIDADSAVPAAPPLRPVGRDRALPLSFAQQRLWFLAQMDPAATDYNVATVVTFDEAPDAQAVTQALSRIVARHESLRTRFVTGADGVPHQVVEEPAVIVPDLLDVSGLDDPQAAVRAHLAADARTPFDLAGGPLIRATLIRIADDRHLLALGLHHIVYDEWSARILEEEFAALYAAVRAGADDPLPPLPVQYADYAVWQREWMSGPVLESQLAHWRTVLADPPVLDLPTDRPRPAVRSSAGAFVGFAVPGHVTAGLRELSRRHGATMFMTTVAVYSVLLARHTGQDDLLIGTPAANRDRAETGRIIGLLLNTLVLRARFDDDPTFAELLARTRAGALAGFAHQDMPFEQLVDDLVKDRDPSRTPLVQALFNYIVADGSPGLELHDRDGVIAKFDLRLVLMESGDRLIGGFEYATALFDSDRIRRMTGHLLALLEAVVADVDVPVSQLPLGIAPPVRETAV
ncbi:amino acid adenylation domain-containing protein, partial [Actinoplanes italicus]